MSAKFNLSLWCEHSRTPLWKVEGKKGAGVYAIDLPREWLVTAAPFLKSLSTTLSLVLPVAAAVPKVILSADDYKTIEGQLALGKATSESLLKGADKMGEWLIEDDGLEPGTGTAIRGGGAVLRQLHAWMKEKDPGFGGLVRVSNKRQEFRRVHPRFEKEY